MYVYSALCNNTSNLVYTVQYQCEYFIFISLIVLLLLINVNQSSLTNDYYWFLMNYTERRKKQAVHSIIVTSN